MPPLLPRKRFRSDSPDRTCESKPKSEAPISKRTRTGKGELTHRRETSAMKSNTGIAPPRKKTLFDDLDTGTQRSSPRQPADLLKSLGEGHGEEGESESEEFEFEDVLTKGETDNDDDDVEFEDIPQAGPSNVKESPISAVPVLQEDLDLTLTRETRISLVNPHNKKQGPSKIERGIRVATHQMHVQFLMWHNSLRNRWCCDKGLQEILAEELMKKTSFEKDLKRWRRDSGLKVDEIEAEEKGKRKGKGKLNQEKEKIGKLKEGNERDQVDWSNSAQRAEIGSVNMSHGDPLFALLNRLSSYWKQIFTITAPGLRKIGYMTLPRIDEEIKSNRAEYDVERHGERIENKESFIELAKKHEGSRDVGAQLFTALLRSLGLEARMVVSLQPVGFGWSKNEEAVERKVKKNRPKESEPESSDETDEDKFESTAKVKNAVQSKKRPRPSKMAKVTAKPIEVGTRRKEMKETPIDLSEAEYGSDNDDGEGDKVHEITYDAVPSRRRRKKPSKLYEKDLAPNYWVEVLSPITNIWIPVNPFAPSEPVATNPDLLLAFEPRGSKADKAKQVIAYVVGFSSDGTAKDVTVRYLKRHTWPGKTKGMRIPVEKVPVYTSNGKIKRHEEYDWFKAVMSGYKQCEQQRTIADDQEEAIDLKAVKPEKKEAKEGEETLQSYKQSAEFVLQRHLRREEALLPTAKHVKLFAIKVKGDAPATEEKVYLRKDVVTCKSVETWHKEGREPKMGEQPLKRVPYRAATTNRKRELAEAELASGGEKMLQGLYSREQTDWIIPPPIENGVIPKNGFGNMDCYVPSMVPRGAVHIPLRGTTRICKKLGIDFADAVTGFEFGARMAIPIITGVIVAEENEEMVIEQWRAYEAERLRKEDEKRTKAALGMWRKFLMGMRIMKRVREEYGEHSSENPDVLNPWTNKNVRKVRDEVDEESFRRMEQTENDMAGGFFPGGHDEEEVPQGFFPTRHEDSEDDDGGFIIEQKEPNKKPTGNVSNAYSTPITLLPNKMAATSDYSTGGKESVPTSKPTLKEAVKTKPKPKYASKPSGTSTCITNGKLGQLGSGIDGQPTSSESASSQLSRNRGEPEKIMPHSDEEELSEISTPDMGSNYGPREECIPPSSRKKGKSVNFPDESPATRVLPKRKASRRSTGTRSQYFESDENNDSEYLIE